MNTINMQCKSTAQIYYLLVVEHVYTDTNLVEIHEEMSKLLGKQVYALNECSK